MGNYVTPAVLDRRIIKEGVFIYKIDDSTHACGENFNSWRSYLQNYDIDEKVLNQLLTNPNAVINLHCEDTNAARVYDFYLKKVVGEENDDHDKFQRFAGTWSVEPYDNAPLSIAILQVEYDFDTHSAVIDDIELREYTKDDINNNKFVHQIATGSNLPFVYGRNDSNVDASFELDPADNMANSSVVRRYNKNIVVPDNPGADKYAVNKGYVDGAIQTAVETIEQKSDVTDIVGTYNDLLDYQGAITLNDIIKVLSDSEHDGAISYYRWLGTTTGTTYKYSAADWDYIGSDPLTYTKSETDTLLAAKVDKTSSTNKVYGTDNGGSQTTFGVDYGTTFTGNVVRRDSSDQVYVPLTPTANGQAASKKYVDDADALKADKTGPLPSYAVNGNDTVSSFITTNNVDGKTIVLKIDNRSSYFVYFELSNNYLNFILEEFGEEKHVWFAQNISAVGVQFDNLMSSQYKMDCEIINHKVTSISSSSTDTQYPSAKAVYSYAEAKANKVTSISSSSTDTEYPSAKAVYSYAEASANKSTSLSASSTDTEYPSAKAVVDFVKDSMEGSYQKVDTTTYPTLADFLASSGEEGIIYLYPIDTSDLTKGYYKYIWENNAWMDLGTTTIDLSNYVDLTTAQTITAAKSFAETSNQTYKGVITPVDDGLKIGTNVQDSFKFSGYGTYVYNSLSPVPTNTNLGNTTYKWKDLYLSGRVDVSSAATSYQISVDGAWLDISRANASKFQFYDNIFKSIANADLGTSAQQWKDLYLNGKVYNSTFVVNNGNQDVFLIDGVNGQSKSRYNFIPYVTGGASLGASSYKWQDIYLSNSIKLGSNAISVDSNDQITIGVGAGYPTLFYGAILPKLDNQYSIGSASQRIKNFNIAGNLSDGTNSYTIGDSYSILFGKYVADNTITTLPYETISEISLSADTTFSLKSAPTGCYPEYRAKIANVGSSAINLTFTGIVSVLCNDASVIVNNNILTLPAGMTLECSISLGGLVAINWSI